MSFRRDAGARRRRVGMAEPDPMKIRHKQLSFWSQFKVVAVASLFAAIFVALAIFWLDRIGLLPNRSGRVHPAPIVFVGSALVGAALAAGFMLCQLAGLWLLRLLPWRGPTLEVAEDSTVRSIFE